MDSVAHPGGIFGAGAVMRPDMDFSSPPPAISYLFECRDAEGNLKWSELVHNIVTTEGMNHALGVILKGVTQVTTWYMGLAGAGTKAAGDTLASHAGWSELTPYSGNRPAITWGTVSAGSVTGTAVAFSITGTATVAGAFVGSVNTGTSGTLYSVADFSVARGVANGDTLNVTPVASFT